MQRTIKLTIAYHGAGFHGWQRQPGFRTVQSHFEDVVRRVLGEPVVVFGASRTDAGVHALGQVAHVCTSATIPLESLGRAVAHRLDADAALVSAQEVPPGFHASRDALEKLYRYRIHNDSHRPVEAQRAGLVWHVWHRLDDDRMRAAADALCGTHDFKGFASSGCARESTVRTIRHVEVRRRFNQVLIDVLGDGFLYNQVRNMVGTLIEIGRGHWPAERIREILAARDRCLAGPTAPACGLCLQWIRYPRHRMDDHAA
ncbi:MAG: tRNA pseudouridine(38-40) synthase TruA [Phycisphaerae bacterium]|jgi:tRNA pseudouridine38-40 synthase